jgi:GDP-L-fucose synthase
MREEYLMTGKIEETSEGYAIAKTAGILACRTYNNQFQTNRFIALLPNSMYGPGDHFDLENSHVLSALIRKFHEGKVDGNRNVTLWGTGSPRREFIFHEDVADASLFAMTHADLLQNMHYNIGSGIDLSIKELAGIIAEIVGFTGEIVWDTTKPDGTPQKLLDSSRFLNLGWKPKTDIRTGIRKTYDGYMKNLLLGDL